jgi:hypothetical protein
MLSMANEAGTAIAHRLSLALNLERFEIRSIHNEICIYAIPIGEKRIAVTGKVFIHKD